VPKKSCTVNAMKSLIKIVIHHAVQNDLLWAILNATVIPVAQYATTERRKKSLSSLAADIENATKLISQNLTVKHGAFQGMRYPDAKSVGSALVPKLLGSYEREIQPLLERICSTEYSEIVDIGCAEGYYAVGLAMRIKTATVFAFDTDKEAIRLCNAMAKINNVARRIVTGSFCDNARLHSIPFTKRGLIISDCEGYERELFTKESASVFAHLDLLIEIHDFLDIGISSHIRGVFEASHKIEVYQSIDDIQKAHQYVYKELDGFDLPTRREILAENRPAIMEWFYMQPRQY